jgi:hypothetical protein
MSANQFGFIPEEGHFTHVSCNTLTKNGDTSQELNLGISSDINASNNSTIVALKDSKETSLIRIIPAGSQISKCEVTVMDSSLVDDNLEFCLGYFSSSVEDNSSTALLAQRTFSDDSRMTGAMLKQYGSVSVCEKLSGKKIELMNKITGNSSAPVPSSGVCIREPIDLAPNITIMKGSLKSGALSFRYCYST